LFLIKIHYDEFIPEFENQYPQTKWAEIQVRYLKFFKILGLIFIKLIIKKEKIFKMIRQVFEGASKGLLKLKIFYS
jgi:hypothetical protein